MDETQPIFTISMAAELAELHPQTLRQYDRLGLVEPGRTAGLSRRYSMRDVAKLREVARLSAEGITLEGIRRILELEDARDELAARVRELEHALADALLAQPGRRVSLREQRVCNRCEPEPGPARTTRSSYGDRLDVSNDRTAL